MERYYLEPLSGRRYESLEELEKALPKKSAIQAIPAYRIEGEDEILECVDDSETMSMYLNYRRSTQTNDVGLPQFIIKGLPIGLEYDIQISNDDGRFDLHVGIHDYSKYPMLSCDMLAERVLELLHRWINY